MKTLVDHNMEGQALLLWGVLAAEGWLTLLPLELTTFRQVGLPINASDRTVWRFAQENQMLLLTGNRQMRGANSLEETIRQENKPESLPVLTVSNLERLSEPAYRERCAVRLIEIALDLENLRGTGRLYLP